MILYKYVSFGAGLKILETSTIGFSQPKFFNDPFDLPAYPREGRLGHLDDVFGRIRTMAKEMLWADNTGILSLTRTATNPLMWAHYADKHKGMVIGIDAKSAGLTDEAHNFIPAHYGSVIYVSARPSSPYIGQSDVGIAVGETHHFPPEHYEKLQRLFLHKPLCWAYEEEVRVLKCLKGIDEKGSETPSGSFSITNLENRQPLYLLSIPPEALREVYFGFRVDIDDAEESYYSIKSQYPNLSIFDIHLLPDTYGIGAGKYSPIAELNA